MTRRRWPRLTLADCWRIWACAARIPVAAAGTVPVVVVPDGSPVGIEGPFGGRLRWGNVVPVLGSSGVPRDRDPRGVTCWRVLGGQVMPTWRVHHGDALAVLPTLPAGSVDLVLTDPPYNSGGRTATERRGQTARSKYVSGGGRKGAQHDLADFAGDNRDQRGFTAWLAMVLAECLRLATPGASALVFTDWRQLPATSDAVQAAGWIWRGIIPWRKPIARPQRDGFRRECEYVLWASHGEPHRHAPTIYLPGLVVGSQPRGTERQHITQKPVAVLRELVRVCRPDGTVLDPFAGAASTGVAALAEDRAFIGVEITEHYATIARSRLTGCGEP